MRVLLVTVDAWRASHAPFGPTATVDGPTATVDGPPTPTTAAGEPTPNLAAFADDAAVFTQAVGHGPATPYAFPGILTSTLPLDHGGYEELGEERTLVSEALADAGWRCSGFHANPWLGEGYGYARGYDTYRDTGEFGLPLLDAGRTFLIDRFGLDHPVYRAAQRAYRRVQTPLRHLTAEGGHAGSAAAGTVREWGDDEFVWVHLLAPHAPYDPPERHREAMGVPAVDASPESLVTRAQREPDALAPEERTAVERLYAAAVRHADEQVGELLELVDDETLVVVTADHGEALFEHGQVGHEPALYDELVRVPLLVRPPGGTDRGVVDAQVRHVDVAPTVLDYAGVEPPPTYRGRSLRPIVEGEESDPPDRRAILEVASTEEVPGRVDPSALRVGVRTPRRKVLYDRDGVVGYDLRADPGERDPIEDPSGEGWDDLRRTLEDRLDAYSFDGVARVDRDAAVQQRLKDLGYLE